MMEIDNEKLKILIEEYKDGFKENIPLELYKWEAVKHFQDNWNIDAEDFPEMLSQSLSKTENLLTSKNNYPRGMIVLLAERFPKEVKGLFSALFDETLDLKERIDDFIASIEKIHNALDDKKAKNHFQTFNVVSTYLWLRYPDKYYIYKPSVAKNLFDRLSIEIKLTPLKANAVIKTYEVYDSISDYLLKDIELKAMFEEVMTPSCYPDHLMRTATIDLGYYLKKKKGTPVTTSKATEKRYWMYAPGENASKWSRCQEQNIICIGWDDLGDLSQFKSIEDCRDELKDIYNKPDSSFKNDGLAVWEFSHVMQQGDIVYAKQGLNNIIGRGVVKSEYFYDSSQGNFCHTRKVEWTHIGNWELKNIVQKTLTDITEYPDYVKKIEAMIVEGKTEEAKKSMYNDKYAAYIKLLLNNNNLILNGAPGTGKTYLAKQVAAQIIYEGNVPENFEEDAKFMEQCGFVQFHPSYDYTDFVEGLRPTRPNQDGNIGFERKDGIFKAFCKKVASQDTNISIEPQVNLEFIRKTDDNPTSFVEVYQKLVNDIRSGNAVLYSDFRSKMTTIKLRVDRINGIDIIKFWKTKDFQNAQYDYLKRIYDYYYSRGIFDIRDKRSEDFVKIIGNTLDYSYYRGIVQGLLERTDRGTTTKAPLSSLHVDRDKDYNVYLSPQPYIFIIDEINRGEISKIFGELFFSVDPGYRGKKGRVQTQYQNLITDETDPFKEGFYIPENVYIIGTMNDIDRSVECMDFAMRRRFTFKEITAEESASNMELGAEATERMMSLNNAISNIDGFNSSFHIGAAYFKDVDDFDALWELKLTGLLKEYLRGMPDAEESLEALKKAYYLSEE